MNCFYADVTVGDFPRLPGEVDDAPRILRAIAAAEEKVVFFPAGIYEIASPIAVTNHASLLLHKSAVLRAIRPMDFVLRYNGGEQYQNLIVYRPDRSVLDDLNLFIQGGEIDGNGLAGCLVISNYHHFTLSESTLRNGKTYGLLVKETGHGYELIATNIYCKCTMSGLAGNTGICSRESDSHYTDCIVVDYTNGISVEGGTANRFTRCHVWGGIVPPLPGETAPEMLKDSEAFHINGSGNILRDCYADTARIGYHVMEGGNRLLGCTQFNNSRFHLNDDIVILHEKGDLLVADCQFYGGFEAYPGYHPHTVVYQGTGDGSVLWRDNWCNKGMEAPRF